MSLKWIRRYYKVPAKRGGRVEYTPRGDGKDATARFGTITGARDGRLLVRLDGAARSLQIHPTWQLRYLQEPPR